MTDRQEYAPQRCGPPGMQVPTRRRSEVEATAVVAQGRPVCVPKARAARGRWGPALSLGAVAAVATGFDYVWVGPLPLWFGATLLACAAAVVGRWQGDALHVILGRLGGRVLTPWLCLVCVMTMSDLYHGSLDASLLSVIGYGLLAIVTFVVTATCSAMTEWRRLTLILALIAAVQGTIAIAQYLGLGWAWRIPDFVLSYTARGAQEAIVSAVEDFGVVGRVRGTSIYVHKFAAFQGVLVGYLLVVVLGSGREIALGRRGALMLSAAVALAVVGAVLTFSRASLIGIVLAFTVVMILRRRRRSQRGTGLLYVAVLVGALMAALDVGGSRHFTRLFEFSVTDSNNQFRYEVWKLGLSEFARAPVLGVGTVIDTSGVGIALHSVAIRMLASYGVLGFLFYVLVVVGMLRTQWAACRSRFPGRQLVALGGLAACLVGLVDSGTHTSGFLYCDIAQPALFGAFLGQAVKPWSDAAPSR